jgi:uncharacterized membrane protein YkvA (DUF1232 family)
VPVWTIAAIVLAATLLIYAAFVVALILLGRRGDARAVAGFVPDCAIFFGRLLRDSRVPRRHKALLGLLVAYLALPFDLVPDFIPIAGQLDDAIIVAFVLRTVLRRSGHGLIVQHWPGPQQSRDLMLRLAGRAGKPGWAGVMPLGFRKRATNVPRRPPRIHVNVGSAPRGGVQGPEKTPATHRRQRRSHRR